ncbi:MAG: hypothetical protein WC943_07225 [Elusimicrobiota bacterium]|jgi:hypothetical protein
MKKETRTHPYGKFEEMPPISRTNAVRTLKSKDKKRIIRVLIRLAFNYSDWRWVQDQCLPFLNHRDASVRGAAATALGHVARIHRRLEIGLVKPQLQRLVDDPDMGDKARDALNDISAYIGRTPYRAPGVPRYHRSLPRE